jgi:hypothetical protein
MNVPNMTKLNESIFLNSTFSYMVIFFPDAYCLWWSGIFCCRSKLLEENAWFRFGRVIIGRSCRPVLIFACTDIPLHWFKLSLVMLYTYVIVSVDMRVTEATESIKKLKLQEDHGHQRNISWDSTNNLVHWIKRIDNWAHGTTLS